jgi:hypothetical protein
MRHSRMDVTQHEIQQQPMSIEPQPDPLDTAEKEAIAQLAIIRALRQLGPDARSRVIAVAQSLLGESRA